MKGLVINFVPGDATLDLGATVSGYDAQVQNMLVNIATNAPAPVFSERGTSLLTSFARTGFISRVYAQHQANFAALDTLYFCKTFNTERALFTDLNLTAPETGNGELVFNLEVAFNGATIGGAQLPV